MTDQIKLYSEARRAYEIAAKSHKGIKSQLFSDQVKNFNNMKEEPIVQINISKPVSNSLSNLQNNIVSQSSNTGFSDIFGKLTKDRIKKIKRAEDKVSDAISGNSNAIEVMAAVAESEIALQEIVLVRDKIIGAYQEILRMSF